MTDLSDHAVPAPAPDDAAPAPAPDDAAPAPAPDDAVPASAPTPQPTFADFGVHPDIVSALAQAGIVHPFPIQAMTMPVASGGHDIIGQAKTGTGKTLGFGVPILQRVVTPTDEGYASLPRPGSPQALVVAPTRELASQVASDLERAGAQRGVRVVTLYGGRAYEPQIETLRRGVDVVVGTPGRLIDLSRQAHLDLSQASTVVLDEADEMLDLGFLPDVETLLSLTAPVRQTMLFSATMPGPVVALARRYMRQPTHIRAVGDPTENAHTVKAVEHLVYRAHALDKVEMLARILLARGRGLTLVFTRTKRTAARVAEELAERGFAAAAIHGDLGQGAREQALRAFRHGHVDVLVATDVAARGIDVENVTHVVNFQCPEDEKTYVHRVGRTARAGNTGIAVTFVDWDDMPRWGLINRQLDLGIPEPEETYSSSPHLFADLDIPTDATGRLARGSRIRAGLAAEELEDLGETGKASGRRGQPAGGRDRKGPARPERGDGPYGERPNRERQRRRTVRSHAADETAAAAAAAVSSAPVGASSAADARPRRARHRRRGAGTAGGTGAPGAG